jgi:uncharacterized protein YjbI with pentapeptide repeats
VNLPNVTYTGWDFSSLCFCHGNFENTIFQDCILPSMCNNANFRGAQLLGDTTLMLGGNWSVRPMGMGPYSDGDSIGGPVGNFCHSDFTGAVWDFGPGGYNSSSYNMAHCNFTGAHFKWRDAPTGTGVVPITGWSIATAAYANMTGITHDANFQLGQDEVNFSFANFTNAYLTDAIPNTGQNGYFFSESNFAFANMTGVKGGWYNGCDCAHTTWDGADLTYSTFTEANLAGADFSNAAYYPEAATFGGAVGSNYNLSRGDPSDEPGSYDSYTKFPPGFDTSVMVQCNTVATSHWSLYGAGILGTYLDFDAIVNVLFGCYAYWGQTLPPPPTGTTASAVELDGYIADYSKLDMSLVVGVPFRSNSSFQGTDLYVSSMSYVDWTGQIFLGWDGYCACLGSAPPPNAAWFIGGLLVGVSASEPV